MSSSFCVKYFHVALFTLVFISFSAGADLHPNLIAWWQFNETSGDVATDSVGSYDGVLTNGVTQINGVVYFDGIDDYIDLPDGFEDFSGGLTMSLWVYPEPGNPSWTRFLELGNGEYTDNIVFSTFGAHWGATFQTYNDGPANSRIYKSSGAFIPLKWQLMTVTMDADGNSKIYRNGTVIASGDVLMPSSTLRVNNYIGKSNWDVNPTYKGGMYDVRIYNTALNENEIQELAGTFPKIKEVWVDNDYTLDGLNDGHDWTIDAFNNIHDALNTVDYGTTIYVNPGIYNTLQSIVLKNGVKLIGAGAETTIIDGTVEYYFHLYPLITTDQCDPNTVLSGFTIRNAGNRDSLDGYNGGAMHNYHSDVIIKNCIFENNVSDSGGGAIHNECLSTNAILIKNCIFRNNAVIKSQKHGGAILGLGKNGTITGCTFINNSVGYYGEGGALASINGTVSNCIFTGNTADESNGNGGAIDGTGKNGVITDCQFLNNSASNRGGAIASVYGIVENCRFEGNHADVGGGIYGILGTVSNCTFENNTADFGGGIAETSSNTENGYISNSTFSSNSSTWNGGGIYNTNNFMEVENCVFQNNIAGDCGGGIYNTANETIISNCKFISNTATDGSPGIGGAGCGGGVYIADRFSISTLIANCLFEKNQAYSSGGGFWVRCNENAVIKNCIIKDNNSKTIGGGGYIWGSANINFCTLVNNSAIELGGGIYTYLKFDSSLPISNTIVWNNSAGISGHEISYFDHVEYSSPEFRYCDIKGCGGSGDQWDVSVGIDGGGNLDTEPLFSDDPNDLHLKSQAGRYNSESGEWEIDDVTSPCIDAGNPSEPIGGETFGNGGYANMGAYGATAEASRSYFGTVPCEVIVAGDINGDCIINLIDLSFIARNWLTDNLAE